MERLHLHRFVMGEKRLANPEKIGLRFHTADLVEEPA
jgi:hypothetical protein